MRTVPAFSSLGLALLALGALLPAGVAHAAEPTDARDEPAGRAPTVMVVGDSHVELLGPALEDRFRRLGARPLPSLARRGWSTGRYRRTGDLTERLREHGVPDVLVVCLGGNDHPYSRAVYGRQLGWLVSEAHEAGVREILWVGPASTMLGQRRRARRTAETIDRNTRWQRELLPGLGVTWTDSRSFTQAEHAPDGLHFSRRGYAHWSDVLVRHWSQAAAEDHSALLSRLRSAES